MNTITSSGIPLDQVRVLGNTVNSEQLTPLQEMTDFDPSESLKNLTNEEIDRDISEISTEIAFLTEQVFVERDQYGLEYVKEINKRIFSMIQRRKLLKSELEKRKKEK